MKEENKISNTQWFIEDVLEKSSWQKNKDSWFKNYMDGEAKYEIFIEDEDEIAKVYLEIQNCRSSQGLIIADIRKAIIPNYLFHTALNDMLRGSGFNRNHLAND